MIYPDRFGTNVRKTQEENTCSTQDGWLAAMDTSAARAWLHGVAYGPGVHISQKQLVERLPAGYALRQYPGKNTTLFVSTDINMIILRQARDKHRESTQKETRFLADISHSLAAMYPQPNWHRVW